MNLYESEFAMEAAGGGVDSGQPKSWGETKVVGKAIPRVDAYERVSGTATYTADVSLPDMLHAAILRCPHAHARIVAIDISKAEQMPGVHAIITGKTPGATIPWYGGPSGKTSSFIFDLHCRYAGEEVAAVAAETAFQAQEALRAIKVEYETLPFVVEVRDALKPGAPALHEKIPLALTSPAEERGDTQKGFAEADVVLEENYRTSCQLHTSMETHGSVARWDGGRLTVWASTQGVFDLQAALAATLQLPLSSVRVIGRYMGGGFGSKLEPGKYTVMAALLARRTGRPVKLCLPREDDFLCTGNRPATEIKLKAGVKKDGTLTAFHLINHGVVGAYPGWAGIGYQVMRLYLCPNAKVEETSVLINAGKECPMRAPGFPQCAWALEQMMDALAEKIGVDPVDFRIKNIAAFNQGRTNVPYTSFGLKDCLIEGAKAFGWKEARNRPRRQEHILRGVGVAAGMWGYPGEPNAVVVLKLFADGSVNLNLGASDLGTGTKTVMAMVVAEELGVPLERIQIEWADTGTTQYAPSSGGSQTALVCSPAVRAAALEVRRQLLELAAEELKLPVTELAFENGKIVPAGQPEKVVELSSLRSLQRRNVVMAVGTRHPNPREKIALPFAAQFAEVEVNTRSGVVKVVRFLAAHDSGRVMNRLTYENQVFGGVTMGLGYALKEQRRLDPQTGRVLNASHSEYQLPTMLDVPVELACLPIDPHDTECNTTGTKGLGEPATIPTAAAIANAVYHATGIRVTETPITPMRMLGLLAASRGRK